MVRPIPAEIVEQKVGVTRHPFLHYAIAIADDEEMMVLHSQECVDNKTTMACPFTLALHNGLCDGAWAGHMDVPVVACLFKKDGATWLGPATTTEDWFIDPELKSSRKIKDIERSSRRGHFRGRRGRV